MTETGSLAKEGMRHASSQFLTALSDAIVRYCLDEDSTLGGKALCFSGFDMARHAQLCYFFIRQPHLLPRFQLFIETGHMSEFAYAREPVLRTAQRVLHFIETEEYAENEALSRYRDRAGRYTYVQPFYYRAAIFHFITAGKKSEAQRWIDEMTISSVSTLAATRQSLFGTHSRWQANLAPEKTAKCKSLRPTRAARLAAIAPSYWPLRVRLLTD